MRTRRNNFSGGGHYGNGRRYDDADSFGSRDYRTFAGQEEGPYGSRHMPGDEYPDEDYYYNGGGHYHTARWRDEADPYEEDLRDEYDRYGVGLSRGRYYGEPYGSARSGSGNYFRNISAVDRREGYRGHNNNVRHNGPGFFRRVGERLRDSWENWRHRDQDGMDHYRERDREEEQEYREEDRRRRQGRRYAY
jgi:hypothetical protein